MHRQQENMMWGQTILITYLACLICGQTILTSFLACLL